MTAVSAGKVMDALRSGTPVPEHYGADENGIPSTDPAVILKKGGLLPLGGMTEGYKGFGLSMMVSLNFPNRQVTFDEFSANVAII